jgi:hypothetical protein
MSNISLIFKVSLGFELLYLGRRRIMQCRKEGSFQPPDANTGIEDLILPRLLACHSRFLVSHLTRPSLRFEV